MVVEQWRPYLHSKEFLIRTDQKSLIYLEEQRLTTVLLHKAFTKLHRIFYRWVKENQAAKAVSWRHHSKAKELVVISIFKPEWLQDIMPATILTRR
jgi:hypothetical protein